MSRRRSKRASFMPGDIARIKHTNILFRIRAVSEDGETLETEKGIQYIAAFCERVPT